jgi:hypothetical protein
MSGRSTGVSIDTLLAYPGTYYQALTKPAHYGFIRILNAHVRVRSRAHTHDHHLSVMNEYVRFKVNARWSIAAEQILYICQI